MNIGEFIAHMTAAAAELQHVKHKALAEAAKLIEHEAKKEIGQYQDEAGSFAGWPELADATKADRVAQGYPEDEPLLRTGELRDSIMHIVDGEAGEAAIGSNSPVAEYQELGTSRIPPRSFLGGAATRKAPEVAELLGRRCANALVGRNVFGGSLPIE